MWRASAVSHQIIVSENANPVANANGITTASGAVSASAAAIIGQTSTIINPTRNGCSGRQRIPTSAPITAPSPPMLSSTPKTPAPP